MEFSLNAVTIDSGCEYVWLMLREWIVPSVRILDDSLMIALGRIVDVHSIEPVGSVASRSSRPLTNSSVRSVVIVPD